jgi:hypothetical protein
MPIKILMSEDGFSGIADTGWDDVSKLMQYKFNDGRVLNGIMALYKRHVLLKILPVDLGRDRPSYSGRGSMTCRLYLTCMKDTIAYCKENTTPEGVLYSNGERILIEDCQSGKIIYGIYADS